MPKPVSRSYPLSIRISAEERAILQVRAPDGNLSAFVRNQLFDPELPGITQSASVLADRRLLAHLLATLGASNVAPNLARLAREAESGSLGGEETLHLLHQACDDIRLMHNALMRGLGLREASPSKRQLTATEHFRRAASPGDQP